jgi:hypothetical protein
MKWGFEARRSYAAGAGVAALLPVACGEGRRSPPAQLQLEPQTRGFREKAQPTL